ncbi:hypothetical protein PPERSA_00592 [Pseudocohnilembus persalinus]|uniref:WH2 domain-containing protein n=1 Tax=Pseudocohnilembus persalinus TaxID=266149 RepID=A0A0V0QT04_PSEPJ|nr:hypothetical protein PPERSA_00592 [Pseudocohnilembus persalinus]|eukprot:KRX05291.1 hypothetical protein PPERSA_00592 [Pseudocohnilembus persalinus]
MQAFLSKKREKVEKQNEQQNEKEGEKQEIGQNLGKLEENRKTLKEIENITESDLMVQQWKEYIQEENLNTYDVQFVGMARVWIFDESVWKNMEIIGALCIVIDLNQDNQIPYIIVYDMNEFEIKFKLEIFVNFQKQVISLNDYFFYIRIPFLRENCQIGFSFSTENQCSNCKRVISKICPKSELNQEKNISGKQNFDHFSANRQSNQQEQKENGVIYEENENQDEYHEIAQEKERLNNLSNLTKEEKEIIRNAGITKKELKENWGKKLEISSLNKNQGSDNKKDSNNGQVSGTRNQLLDQIRNNQIKLRHVETNKVKKDQEKYTKEDKVDLAANLATEIKKRRQIIRKNYMDSDESEESDWDEDSDYDM